MEALDDSSALAAGCQRQLFPVLNQHQPEPPEQRPRQRIRPRQPRLPIPSSFVSSARVSGSAATKSNATSCFTSVAARSSQSSGSGTCPSGQVSDKVYPQ
jgi:hypothetical protein